MTNGNVGHAMQTYEEGKLSGDAISMTRRERREAINN
jgi:hypothetical protein